ncbi:hypothetical protein H4R18_003969, partial [Coemansia javaensis]
FQPSPEWVLSWLPDLPLDPIIDVLGALATHIDRIGEDVQREAEAAAPAADAKVGDAKAAGDAQPGEGAAGGHADTAAEPGAAAAVDPTAAIIRWLGSDAMARALPDLTESMPEIRPRLQGMSPALMVWFRSLLWSLIYASGMKPYGIWKNTQVRLFVVKNTR